ncbi:MAG: hypothetical protein RLZZ162_3779, partial [Verrucomicrobiota bacterium]
SYPAFFKAFAIQTSNSLNEKLQSIGAALGLVDGHRCVATAE